MLYVPTYNIVSYNLPVLFLVYLVSLKVYVAVVDSNYSPTRVSYKLGIDKSKVLMPSSIIDGGIY